MKPYGLPLFTGEANRIALFPVMFGGVLQIDVETQGDGQAKYADMQAKHAVGRAPAPGGTVKEGGGVAWKGVKGKGPLINERPFLGECQDADSQE